MKEERIKEDVIILKLPISYEEENRGLRKCCDPEMVLASSVSNDSWKNDITPAWIKMYYGSDTATFTLKKDGVDATYQPVVQTFPSDIHSRYVEVNWKQVLATDGIGCYSIHRSWNIGGSEGEDVWGNYELLNFTSENAEGTARLRAKFNHYHEIEDINFKGANVNGTIRFAGFIGNRQPNKEIDTLIYSNREVKNVVVENLNTYEMKTDPLKESMTRQLIDLYLLSEVELYASDYNKFNHSYRILDIPVILEETEELEYKEFNRGANVNAKLSDKFKNKRTYYS
jgi:hypothetical protein